MVSKTAAKTLKMVCCTFHCSNVDYNICTIAGGDGFIIVDLPPEEASREIVPLIDYYGLNFIPLISPTTTEDRMALIAKVARGFVYCVRYVSPEIRVESIVSKT